MKKFFCALFVFLFISVPVFAMLSPRKRNHDGHEKFQESFGPTIPVQPLEQDWAILRPTLYEAAQLAAKNELEARRLEESKQESEVDHIDRIVALRFDYLDKTIIKPVKRLIADLLPDKKEIDEKLRVLKKAYMQFEVALERWVRRELEYELYFHYREHEEQYRMQSDAVSVAKLTALQGARCSFGALDDVMRFRTVAAENLFATWLQAAREEERLNIKNGVGNVIKHPFITTMLQQIGR